MRVNDRRHVRRGDDDTTAYGPLGPGHAPAKDPLKGLRGVMAGTMIMEFITFLLVLPVVARVDEGAYNTPLNLMSVTALCVALLVMAFLQKKKWALGVDLVLQGVAIGGFIVHPAMGAMGIVFALVWAYICYLRKNLIERMKRGLLPTQHTEL
ncbi:DUF4233 domain-containing protein [Corynebacterium kroppenstedtii]|uniref:DUF4233 domain-containing protein n=1 Tax=Corynebacterium sp. PCR 32 TaxID=3351342 RepID=UPI0030A9E050